MFVRLRLTVPLIFWCYLFRTKKRAIAATNFDGEDVYAPKYVCLLAYLLSIHQFAFSSEHASAKKVRTKKPSTPSQSIKSAFVNFYLLLYSFYPGTFFIFYFYSGKKCAIAMSNSDNEEVFIPRYVLCIIFQVIYDVLI